MPVARSRAAGYHALAQAAEGGLSPQRRAAPAAPGAGTGPGMPGRAERCVRSGRPALTPSPLSHLRVGEGEADVS